MRTSFPVYNGFAPAQGPRTLPVPLDFSNATSLSIDLAQELAQNSISFIQSVYVDNTDNANALTLTFSNTGQRIVVPATAQGIWPVIATDGAQITASTTATTNVTTIAIMLINVPMPLTQWGPLGVTINNVTATFTPAQGNFTDKSGTITLGGTSQQLAAVNANRKRLIVQNPSSEIESLFINFTDAAALGTSIELPPGAMWDSGMTVTTEAVNIIGATTGHKFVAKEQ